MIRIIVVNRDETERNRICASLSIQNDFEIIGQGKDGYDAFSLVRKHKPDTAILDICLDVMEGTDSVPLLKTKSPKTEVIFLTSLEDDEHIRKAVKSHVRGYLLKGCDDMDTLIKAIRLVHNGRCFMSPRIEEKIYYICASLLRKDENRVPNNKQKSNRSADLLKNISKMEFKILACIGRGHSEKETAEELSISYGTVRNYLSSAMHKIGLSDRTQVPLFVIENGLIHN